MLSDRPGIVTNVFRCQLDAGDSLTELIAEAHRRGFRTFELRQGALGELEPVLQGKRLTAFCEWTRQFPDCEFNLAIDWPVFSRELSHLDPFWECARNLALELRSANGSRFESVAHLRIVDTTAAAALLAGNAFERQLDCLEFLVVDALASGVRVSLEHARQPARVVRAVLRALTPRIEAHGFVAPGNLGLCYDPCNLVNCALEREDPVAITASLRADEILMFHLKQSERGHPLPVLTEGDVDWPAALQPLRRLDYRGPWCFEIAPHPDLWTNLELSRDYLTALGGCRS